ncbi:MAG TPA: 4-alpha-glucanotransferase, partial [Pirellulales bacterium]|nr:4-alpha-glucanotransferase [Pirellulales bacterium]
MDARPRRSSGILLHPTSLPGPFGVGDLGPAALAWVDLLAAAKQRWWQVLP